MPRRIGVDGGREPATVQPVAGAAGLARHQHQYGQLGTRIGKIAGGRYSVAGLASNPETFPGIAASVTTPLLGIRTGTCQ